MPAKEDLLDYAVKQYVAGKASLSQLVTKTGLDVTMLMDAIAEVSATQQAARDTFLAAAKTISKAHKDPSFYELALKALAS